MKEGFSFTRCCAISKREPVPKEFPKTVDKKDIFERCFRVYTKEEVEAKRCSAYNYVV